MPHVPRAYGGHLHNDHLAKAEESTELFLGSVVGQERRRWRRGDRRAASLFRRLLGQRSRPRRSLGQRSGRALDENRRQVLRRFLVSALPTSRKNYSAARSSAFPMSSAVQAAHRDRLRQFAKRRISKLIRPGSLTDSGTTGVQSLDTLAQMSKYAAQGGKP